MKKVKSREIIFSLLKIKNLLNKAGKKNIFSEFGLSVANYEVLKVINDEDIQKLSDLKIFFSDSLPSLTQKTQKLEELGYLKKEIEKDDPRKKRLNITENGLKALVRVEKKIEIVSSTVFLKYSQEEKENFLKILRDLEFKLNKMVE